MVNVIPPNFLTLRRPRIFGTLHDQDQNMCSKPTHVIDQCMKTLNEISKIIDQSQSRIIEIFEPKYPYN